MKKKIAVLMTGILFALMLGIGCGKEALENIAAKKTEADSEKETVSPEQETETSEAGKERRVAGQEERERKTVFQEEPGETKRQKALRERLGAPETYQAEFTDAKGVSYKIDANISLPDAESFVTVPARLKTFGDEEVEQYVKPLLGEGGLYRWEPEEYGEGLEQIARMEYRLRKETEEPEEFREIWEEQIQWNRERMEEGEDEARKVEVPLHMTPYNKMESGQYFDYLFGLTDWEQRTMYLLTAQYGFTLYPWPLLGEHSCTISEEQAKAFADEYVEKMGLSGELVLDRVDRPTAAWEDDYYAYKAAYEFHYTRQVGGVPISSQDAGRGGCGLDIQVDDSGVVSLGYDDYILEGDGKAVEILPFSEIQKVCEEEWRALGCNRLECISLSVDEIRLTYSWDEEGTEQMIPVWEVSGTSEVNSEEGEIISSERRESLLLINAIDGTIIRRF
ncbi:MAG: hypothetical protein HFI67_04755 [Lachnospiraceae bacterium]|nr:hypothetical protein [Lachnospiraceae bacterium]